MKVTSAKGAALMQSAPAINARKPQLSRRGAGVGGVGGRVSTRCRQARVTGDRGGTGSQPVTSWRVWPEPIRMEPARIGKWLRPIVGGAVTLVPRCTKVRK